MPVARTPRSNWVEEGLRALAAGGPDSVRIEQIARSLGVTKGGFYWHFEDRVALLDEMLQAWEKLSVDEVIDAVEAVGGDSRSRLWALFAAATGERARIDLAFREWARRDRKVARRMQRVDSRRMDYLRSLFRGICEDQTEIEVRCLLVCSLWIANPLIAVDHDTGPRADVVAAAMRLLVR